MVTVIFIFAQDNDSDSMDLIKEEKKREKKSNSKKNKSEECERNGSSETDNLAEMEFIDNAVKATKAVKKTKKEKKKKKQK